MTLKDIRAGESCIVTKLEGEGALRQHLLDMGVLPGTELTVVKYAPMGDPIEVRIHGYELTLRLADAEQIIVDPCEKKSVSPEKKPERKRIEHPGLGEGGRFHLKDDGTQKKRKEWQGK